MKRLRFELENWDKGRRFMKEIAAELDAEVEERGEILKIDHPDIDISCNLDTREFSFILAKLYDESLETKINAIRKKYQ